MNNMKKYTSFLAIIATTVLFVTSNLHAFDGWGAEDILRKYYAVSEVELSNYAYFKAKLNLENGKVYVDCDNLKVKIIFDSRVPNDYKLVAVKHIQAYDIHDPNFDELKADAAKGKTEWVWQI